MARSRRAAVMAPCAKLRLVRQVLIGDPDKMTGARLSFGGCQARPGQGFIVGALRRYATVGVRATRALAIGSTTTRCGASIGCPRRGRGG
jgi:hypothetical protein